MHLPHAARLAVALLGSWLSLPAQTNPPTSPPLPKPVQTSESGDVDVGAEGMKEKMAADGKIDHSAAVNPAAVGNFAFAQLAMRPRRLAPGESGTLAVVLVLNNPAVVTADTPVLLEYEPEQHGVHLGAFTVQPAKPGTLPSKYKGVPVWDNTVTIDVPISVAGDAAPGDKLIQVRLKTALTSGTAAQSLGELVLPVSGTLKIGSPLPKPVAVERESAGSAATSRSGGATATSAPVAANKPPEPVADSAAKSPGKFEARLATVSIPAVGADGVAIEVRMPDPNTLPLGGECRAEVVVKVPEGMWLSRASGALGLDVLGVADGVDAEVGAWPAPGVTKVGDAEESASSGTLTVPVMFRASADATEGPCDLNFRLSYRKVGSAAAGQTLDVPAVLAVGIEQTRANPWIFYAVGGGLALLVLGLLIWAIRR